MKEALFDVSFVHTILPRGGLPPLHHSNFALATHSFSNSMTSSGVAPAFSAFLMWRRVPGVYILFSPLSKLVAFGPPADALYDFLLSV